MSENNRLVRKGSLGLRKEYEQLKSKLGVVRTDSIAKDCPDIKEAINAAEAVLTLSSTTNGHMAVKAWEALEKQTDLKLRDLAEEREEECFTFEQITAQPKTVITSPAFTGSEKVDAVTHRLQQMWNVLSLGER